MESVLNECLGQTNDMILNLIEIETSLINTNHPDFIGSADSLLNLFSEQPDQTNGLATEDEPDQKTFSLLSKQPTQKLSE
jgi:dynamin 1-like protein